ncbi:MAG: TonB-dependent receptor [Pseudomonadota bacterium]
MLFPLNANRTRNLCAAITFTAIGLSFTPICNAQPDDEQYVFDQVKMPLNQALKRFAKVTRVSVAVDSELVENKTANAITGNLTPIKALEMMIDGTGLDVIQFENDVGFSLKATAEETQNAESDDQLKELEVIRVIGTKRNSSLQDTQTSVAVFQSEDFEKQVAFEFDDLVLRTPNVSSSGSPSDLSIRGVSRRGISGSGGVTSNTYSDGVPLVNRSILGVDSLWDVAQVEILRGPQSTTQGRNALSGAVVIQTQDPSYDFEADARLRAGEMGTRQYSGMVSGPILQDQIAFRIAADRQEYEGDTVFDLTGTDVFQLESQFVRSKLLFEPEALEGFRAELIVEFVDTEFFSLVSVAAPLGATGDALDSFDPYGGVSFAEPNLNDTESDRYILDLSYDISQRWNLIGLLTYEESESVDIGGAALFPDAATNASRGTDIVAKTYSAELRANFELDKLSGWFGAYFYEEDSQGGGFFEFPFAALSIPTDPADAEARIDISFSDVTTNWAVFADVTYKINDDWSLNFGARFDEEELDESGLSGTTTVTPNTCNIPAFGGLPCAAALPPTVAQPQKTTFDAFLPRFTITYKITENQSIAAGIQRGYRAGGSFLLLSDEGPSQGNFNPEFLTNYELSYRSAWFDNDLIFNVNAFLSDWSDQQVSIPTQLGVFTGNEIVNGGKSEIAGLEMVLEYQINNEWEVFATLGLLETEVKDFPFAVNGDGSPVNPDNPEFANLAGNEFPFSPGWEASAGFSYQSHNWFSSFNVNASDKQYSDILNLDSGRTDSIFLANANVGYDFGNYRVLIYANNLFDEQAITSSQIEQVTADTGVISNQNQASFNILRPRIVGIQFDASF